MSPASLRPRRASWATTLLALPKVGRKITRSNPAIEGAARHPEPDGELLDREIAVVVEGHVRPDLLVWLPHTVGCGHTAQDALIVAKGPPNLELSD